MNKQIRLIIFFFLLQGIIHNIGHPVTPAFVRGLEIPDFMFGVFFASMSFGLMIGGPIWGVLSDQGHAKRWIVIGLLMYSIGQFFFGYIGNMSLMVFFRFFSGFGVVSAITIMTSQVIAMSDIRDREKHLAYLAAAFTLGASLGYYVGGFISTNPFFQELLGTQDYRVIFLIQAVANTGYALWAWIGLHFSEEHITTKKTSLIQGIKQITKVEKSLIVFMISLTLITLGSTNLSKYIDVYFDELGYDPQQLGTYVMATGIVSLFASIFIVPMIAKIKNHLAFIAISHLIASIIVFYVFRGQPFLILMYTVYMIYVIIKTVYQPLEQSYVAKYAQQGQYGSIMGLRQSFVSLGMVIGPLIGGFIYDYQSLLLFDSSAYAFIAGVFLLFLVHVMRKKEGMRATDASHDFTTR